MLITIKTCTATILTFSMIKCFDMTETLTKVLCLLSSELIIVLGFIGHMGSWGETLMKIPLLLFYASFFNVLMLVGMYGENV
jgi:hypothetical protein